VENRELIFHAANRVVEVLEVFESKMNIFVVVNVVRQGVCIRILHTFISIQISVVSSMLMKCLILD